MRLNADMGEDAERLWDLKAFTDNLVIGHPVRQDGEPELGRVLMDIAALQLDLAREAFFVRGGVAVGPLYMSQDIVFGAGLLDAPDAEQQADVPRVVLHVWGGSARCTRFNALMLAIGRSVPPARSTLYKNTDGRTSVWG